MKTTGINKSILAIALLLIVTACGESKEDELVEIEKNALPKVTVKEAKRKTFIHQIRVQGNIETEKDAMISSEMAGVIVSVKVKEGDHVKTGQTIATVDATILASNIDELKSQLEYAEYMLAKQKELHARGVGSEFDLEAAKNQVNSLTTKLTTLGRQQGKSVIKAPFSGVVDQVYAKDGQMASPQSPVIRLVNNDEVYVVSSISEKHLANIKVGTDMHVTFPNYSDTSLNLKVTSVGNYIEATNRTFRLRSLVKNNKLLLPNMLAEVSITDLVVNDGLVIPSKSVLIDNESRDYVFVATKTSNGYQVTKRVVEVVSRYNGEALINSKKIKKGEMIVVEGARGIADQEIVRIK